MDVLFFVILGITVWLIRKSVGIQRKKTEKQHDSKPYKNEATKRTSDEVSTRETTYKKYYDQSYYQKKGEIGEEIVAQYTSKLGSDYHRLRDVVIVIDNGTTQIDNIIVSKFGIFVLEIKNYNGWIFGKEKESKWTQRFETGHTFQFQNPLVQNQRHIRALCQLLRMPRTRFFSVVVFIKSNSKIMTSLPTNVTTEDGCIAYIQSHRTVILTDAQVQFCVNKISSNCLSDNDHQQFMDRLRSH